MREIGFLSRDGVAVSQACRTSGGSTHPMNERAIVIFELEEKRGKKKKIRAEVMELTDGRDGEECAVFKLRQNGSCAAMHLICNKKQKGIQHWYHLLMRTTNKTPETGYLMIQPLSCHVI